MPTATGNGADRNGVSTGASPMLQVAATTATDLWNDSCVADELADAIANGAVGATSNPSLVLDVLRKEAVPWRARIRELAAELPTASEAEIAWRIAEEMAVRGAAALLPVFERTGGRQGCLSIQVNPADYRNADAMVAQAVHFAGLAPNLQVKLPVTTAGLAAIEEVTARGISVNATVNFTVPGALAVADAVERGLDRRSAAGQDIAAMHPVCTIMAGRVEDWLKVVTERDGTLVTPGVIEWSGVAVVKRAYGLYGERGYRTRILAGAFRNHLPWSQLIGGDIVLTIPPAWQRLINASALPVAPAMDRPVDPAVITELETLPEFRRAWEPDGMAPTELETYGAAVRTLRAFITAYHDLLGQVRDVILPDPDKRAAAPEARA